MHLQYILYSLISMHISHILHRQTKFIWKMHMQYILHSLISIFCIYCIARPKFSGYIESFYLEYAEYFAFFCCIFCMFCIEIGEHSITVAMHRPNSAEVEEIWNMQYNTALFPSYLQFCKFCFAYFANFVLIFFL